MPLPKQYAWLEREPGPKILVSFLKLYGIREIPGVGDNPEILAWAKEVGVGATYKHDSIAWCGLAMAIAVHRAGYQPVYAPLWAKNWSAWGDEATIPMLGDVLVFDRTYTDAQGRTQHAGHVGEYVGEDTGAYHVLAGNTKDRVEISRVAKGRLVAARRTAWKIGQPVNVRRVYLDAAGGLSKNEA
jgi:uncharacterized protein (TIGR02594 family)